MDFTEAEKMAMYFKQASEERMKKPCIAFPGKFSFSFHSNGQQYNGFFSSVLSHTQNTSQNANWQDVLRKGVSFMGAMYGIGGMGSFDWGRYYDLILVYPNNIGSDYETIFDNFLKNFDYGPMVLYTSRYKTKKYKECNRFNYKVPCLVNKTPFVPHKIFLLHFHKPATSLILQYSHILYK